MRGWSTRFGGELIHHDEGADLTLHSIMHSGRQSFVMGPKHDHLERVRAGVSIIVDEDQIFRDCSVLIPNKNDEVRVISINYDSSIFIIYIIQLILISVYSPTIFSLE